jgi:putative modified peptide
MSFQLSETVADALLDRLSSDDAFRSMFVADPRAALATVGFAPAADVSMHGGIWMCMSVTELASKEAIRAGRNELRNQLVLQRASHSPIHLEVATAQQVA